MYVTGATVPGDAATPNEDWMALTPESVMVLDGATVRTGTGCEHGVPWYTQRLGEALLTRASRGWPLHVVLRDAIEKVAGMHPHCDLEHPGTPSAAVGMVSFTGPPGGPPGRLRFLILGDITIIIETVHRLFVFSDPRVSATAAAERIEMDRYPIGSCEKTAAMLTMKHAELAARNQPGGYWIAATDPTAAEHAIIGEFPAGEVRRFAVLSDGATRYVDLFGRGDYGTVLDLLARSGPRWFIERVRRIEYGDPFGVRHPRNKRSDDATAVFVDLAEGGFTSRQRLD